MSFSQKRRFAVKEGLRGLARFLPYVGGWASPLVRPIVYVNSAALAFLAFGILFLAHYEERLISAELDVLKLEGRLIANALVESAVEVTNGGDHRIDRAAARDLLKRMARANERRLQLYDKRGNLLLDTRRLAPERDRVAVTPLPPPEASWFREIKRAVTKGWQRLVSAGISDAPGPARRRDVGGAVTRALNGSTASGAASTDIDRLRLFVAVPVQPYREILGAVRLGRPGSDVVSGITAVRTNILGVFAVALAITVALSGYLAWRLATPIRQLASAAERLRTATIWDERANLPDFSHRRDEIGELSQALQGMTAALQRRVDATERFAADVAHEFKNPLGSIQSAVETLKIVDDEQKRSRLLEVIDNDVVRLNRLIQDISTASRLEGLLARGDYEEIDLHKMINDLVEKYRAGDAAPIVFDNGNEGAFVLRGQPGRLEEVFDNLLANAISFTPSGGQVAVRMARHSSRDRAGFESAAFIRVVVNDEGPGLPGDDPSKLFERFYSDRSGEAASSGHSGLGLAIAAQIVAAHQGSITAANRRDAEGTSVGARFVVDLPAL